MISENEHLRQRMLLSRLDDEWYLVIPEMFGSKEDYVLMHCLVSGADMGRI